MADETRNAENEPDQPGEPSATESPDASADSREKSEEDYVRVPKQEFAAWKSKAERANELERELAARSEPSPAAPETDTSASDDYWREVKGFADRGDPVARAMIEEKRRTERLVGAVGSLLEVNDIEDADERKQVKQRVLKGESVQAAHQAVRNSKLEAENKRLAAELAKHNARRADPDVVRTHEREVFASELKPKTKLTESQWDARQKYLYAQGPEGARKAREEQAQYARGDVDIDMNR